VEQAEASLPVDFSEEESNARLYFFGGLFVASLLLLGAGFWLLYRAEEDSRVVAEIKVEGNSYFADGEILEMSGLSVNRPISRSELEQLKERLLLQPGMVDFSYQRDGARLTLFVVERQCAAIIRTGMREQFLFEVDYDLFIISENRVRCKNIPLVSGQFERDLDRFRDMRLFQVLQGFAELKKNYPEIASRISEIRPGGAGELSIFTTNGSRMELAGPLDGRNIKRLYAAFSFMEQEKRGRGIFDLRGTDVLFVPGI
jgi:cell division protein FtsQ